MSSLARSPAPFLLAALAAFLLAACGKTPETEPTAAMPESTEAPVEAPVEEAAPADELARKAGELDRREAELALKEREAELARREAELTAQSKPAPAAPRRSTPAATPAAAPAAAPVAVTPAPAAPTGPVHVTVPAGTSMSVQLTSAVTTKTARVGDRVSATLVEDLVVGGRTVARAGALVQGGVTEVVSGSDKVGGVPALAIAFDSLVAANGADARISGRISELGKSDTGRDAAKIAGGALAGAILGNQVGDKGKIIGGILGAAAGTAIAKRTGTEVELPAGTVLGIVLEAPLEVTL